jgi:predicted nuclease of predicted toxin-antitoxin system
MHFLCDVHISYQFSKHLELKGFRSTHVNFILNKWNTIDEEISRYADVNDLILVTKDLDFKNSHFLSKSPKKLIRIVLGNISNEDLIQIFNKNIDFIISISSYPIFYLELYKDSIYSVP